MSKKVTEDESYLELITIIQSLRADLYMLARLFDKKNGTVTREDVRQELEERKKRREQN
jgi:hypothetical protein